MIAAERLAQMERDLNEMAKRKTAVAVAAVDMGQKLIAEVRRLQQDLEDARRMYREDMTDFDDEDPTS